MRHTAICVAFLCLVPTSFLRAQIGTGDIYGRVADASGGVLPGAAVTLSGPFSRSTVSGAQGDFRFLRLDAETYHVTVTLPGFASVEQTVRVTTGERLHLDFRLEMASVQESLTVVAETPVIDPQKLGTQSTIDKAEAVLTPNARDVWSVIRTIPGVVSASTNTGGEQAGQQTIFTAKGAPFSETTWSMDGVQIDLMEGGATPTYFDYDFFEELTVTTGGNPLNVQSGGIGLNFVTRRGTNQWHGSAKGYLTHDAFSWTNIQGTELENDPRLLLLDGTYSDKADRVQQINDYGFDIGGPLIRDELFIYGLYGRQDIRHVRTDQNADKTLLESFSAKLNWQANPSTSASVFWFNGKKTKQDRPQASGMVHDQTALFLQTPQYDGFLPLGIHGLLKFEVNHIFSPDLFLRASYANYDTGWGVTPHGTGPGAIDFEHGEIRGTGWDEYTAIAPLKHLTNVEASYFADGWGGQHELKIGFGYKRTPKHETDMYGGWETGLVGYVWGPGAANVEVYRLGRYDYEGEFFHAYVGDTFSRGRLTVTGGLRFDHQSARNLASTVPASPSFPELLPAIDYSGGGVGISWNDVSPRGGITFALDESRKTVLRVSLAAYAGKLATWEALHENPLLPSLLGYVWNDLDGDGLPQPPEVDFDAGLQYWWGVDPADPAALEQPNTIDPDYQALRDYEVILGLQHELLPELALGAAYTWRRSTDVGRWDPRIGMTSADYTPNDPVTANGYTAQTFSPDPGLVAATGGGRIRTNRPDYHRRYDGLELTLQKRRSNGWMLRAAFSWMDWREYLDGPEAIHNPTRTHTSNFANSGPGVDGGQVVLGRGGTFKGPVYMTAKWQLSATGLVELPAGFELGAALFARQGFANPVLLNTRAGLDGRLTALAQETVDEKRLSDVWNLDLRLGKNFRLTETANLMLEASLFNVFNSNTELNRFNQAQSSSFDRLDGIMNPRIARLGARLTF